MNRVMYDMSNLNTLVSLAYIKTSNNPLAVFSNYILYLLIKAPDKKLRLDELKTGLSEQFGLNMPQQMINSCIRILKSNGEIVVLPGGGGYMLGTTAFDIDVFEANMRRLHEQETAVIKDLIAYVSTTYKIDWAEDAAKTYLSSFLNEEGNGVKLFLAQNIDSKTSKITPSWYIGRYITFTQAKTDSVEKAYLEDIVNGMMIYEGVYQTNDYQQDRIQKFRGTTFYFDTKLILRALGYSWDAQVQSVKEFIHLIQNEYNGNIGIFHQTIAEVENALLRAGNDYKDGVRISDRELRMYAELHPTGASLMCEASTSVKERLKKEFSIHCAEDTDWNADETRGNSIDETQITDFILKKHEWRAGAVKNDVAIINQINILRKGDYSVRYGEKKKLPVFVTTNKDLVFTFREYVSETLEQDPTANWSVQALPIISDNMVLFRLWVPYASKYNELPALTLSRYAYAAQNSDTAYFEKLRETTFAYQQEHGVDLINLSEIRRQKLEDILAAKTQGDADELSVELVASSVDELVKMESISLREEISSLQDTVKGQENEIDKRDDRIIELAANPLVNRIGRIPRLLIFLSRIWWVLTSLILYILSSHIVGYVSDNVSIPLILTAVPIVVQIILLIADKWMDKKDAQKFAVKWAIEQVWKGYVNKCVSKISKEEEKYKAQIIDYCLEQTPLFKRYSDFCTYRP